MSGSSKDGKQYGLVLSKKAPLSTPKAGNVFGEDSGSEGDGATDWVKNALKAEGEKNLLKKQTRLSMRKALNEDPTVYQYDEVYDDMERTKIEGKVGKKALEQKPKYIENLLKAADRRKREQEHRVERMVQKEREAEGAMFADKESFVTSAYRAKLEEFKQMEEEDKRMDRLEAIGDVTKQKDMSGFYRHLYRQTVDADKKSDDPEGHIKEQQDDNLSLKLERNVDRDSNKEDKYMDQDDPLTTSERDSNSDQETVKDTRKPSVLVTKKRQYRKRMAEQSESSSEDEPEKKTITESEKLLSSLVEDCSNKHDELQSKKQRLSSEKLHKADKKQGEIQESNQTDPKDSKRVKSVSTDTHATGHSIDDTAKGKSKQNPKQLEKPKISIWEKRTIGPVFEAALQRYYARKAERLAGS